MPLNPTLIWLDALRRDPDAAVADLFAGQIDQRHFSRLDYAEFLSRALAEPGADPASRDYIDQGLSHWLANCQANDLTLRQRLGVQAYLYRLNEALVAIVLLKLPRSAYQLREMHIAYRRWLEKYDFGYGDSPYAGYWRALAATQVDRRFQNQWNDFVIRAGDHYPPYALNIGLSGLRGLALPSDERLLRMLNALLRRAWRIGTDAAATEFAKRLGAISTDMPMANDGWRGRVLRLLESLEWEEQARMHSLTRLHSFEQLLARSLKPWIGDIGLGRATAQSIQVPNLPTLDEFSRVAQELNERRPSAVIHALDLFERYRANAEASGEAYFFVRTLCNLGHRVLQQPSANAHTVENLRTLLRPALVWEPNHPYSWNLWAELEQAAGREDVAEMVLWETVRRFPHEEPSRVELALLLQRRHERERSTTLLAAAEQLLNEAISAKPGALHSRSELARLLARKGQVSEARQLLTQWLANQENPVWQRMLEDINLGTHLDLPKPKLVRNNQTHIVTYAPSDEEMHDLRANAAATRFAYARERGEAGDPADLADSTDVGHFYRYWFGLERPIVEQDGVRPPYAIAALAALANPTHWNRLERDYPANARDTWLLKLYAGITLPTETRAELVAWLESAEEATTRPEESNENGEVAEEIETSGTNSQHVSYEDFLRRRLRTIGFLSASTTGRLATADRSSDIDRLIEKHLARSIDADIPPIPLAA